MRRRLFRCSRVLGFFGGFLFGGGCLYLVDFCFCNLRLTFQFIGALRCILNGGVSDVPRGLPCGDGGHPRLLCDFVLCECGHAFLLSIPIAPRPLLCFDKFCLHAFLQHTFAPCGGIP